MCYFLELGISKVSESLIDSLSTRYITVGRENMTDLRKYLLADFVTCTLYSGGCSCNLYAGPRGKPRDIDKELEKFKKRGWSEAKIQRALKDKYQDRPQSSFRSDVKLLLNSLLQKVERFYLLVQWANDDVKDIKSISRTAFLEADAPVVENEVVLVS